MLTVKIHCFTIPKNIACFHRLLFEPSGSEITAHLHDSVAVIAGGKSIGGDSVQGPKDSPIIEETLSLAIVSPVCILSR